MYSKICNPKFLYKVELTSITLHAGCYYEPDFEITKIKKKNKNICLACQRDSTLPDGKHEKNSRVVVTGYHLQCECSMVTHTIASY